MGVPYDYMSISHYRKDLYGAGKLTIETLDKKYQDLIGTLRHLSPSDVKQLALMYRCDGKLSRFSLNSFMFYFLILHEL